MWKYPLETPASMSYGTYYMGWIVFIYIYYFKKLSAVKVTLQTDTPMFCSIYRLRNVIEHTVYSGYLLTSANTLSDVLSRNK